MADSRAVGSRSCEKKKALQHNIKKFLEGGVGETFLQKGFSEDYLRKKASLVKK
jgi:hypothetical protein